MDLYYGRSSGNSSRAVFALTESGAPWRRCFVDTRAQENRTDEYLAINPMGKIPALIDGDFCLWESNAINWYVAEKYPESRLLPTTMQGRAAVQRWLYFQSGHVSPACLAVFRVTNPRVRTFWGIEPDEKAAATGRKELARYLPVLESTLQEQQWLEGEFSLADIAYVPHFVMLAEGGFDFAAYPHVREWLERLCARPSWKETYALIFGEREASSG